MVELQAAALGTAFALLTDEAAMAAVALSDDAPHGVGHVA
jgi:hypothetical protein